VGTAGLDGIQIARQIKGRKRPYAGELVNVHMDEKNDAIHWNVFRELGLISNDIIMCTMD